MRAWRSAGTLDTFAVLATRRHRPIETGRHGRLLWTGVGGFDNLLEVRVASGSTQVSNFYLNHHADVAESFRAAGTADEITQVCGRFARELGFEYFIYGAYIPVVDNIVVLNGFPAAWRQHYVQSGYISTDPTVRHCSQSTTPVQWDRIPASRRGRRAAAERQVMDEAADSGLKHGISVPVHGAGAEWVMLSLVASSAQAAAAACEDRLYDMQFLTQSAHEAVKRLYADQIDEQTEQKRLTDREKECLQWTANGKTAWEISRILSLSESTVTFHLKNAIQKMDVTNRPHAVAKALAQSRITLF